MLLDLDYVKQHLNIESSFTDDDQYILGLMDVAEQVVRKHVNEDFDTLADANGGCFPAPLVQAALLFVGNMYQNREVISPKAQRLPFNYQYIIDLYRNYCN